MVKCYQCKENVKKDKAKSIEITKESAKRRSFRYLHENCFPLYQKEQEINRQRKEEYKKWDELYQYVKNEIFKYEQHQKLSNHMVGRLQGLRSGNYSFRRNTNVFLSDKGYSYDVILLTFKYKKQDILKSLYGNTAFQNEKHKEDYVMAIISNNINDVYVKLQERERSRKRVEEINPEPMNQKAVFKNKTKINKNKVANKLKDLF